MEDKVSGAFIGFTGLQYQDDWSEGEHKTEVGWRLDRSFWGNGLATEAALASLRCSFQELGLECIISVTLPDNVASRRVIEKAGLTRQGETCWRSFDIIWYALNRQVWEARRKLIVEYQGPIALGPTPASWPLPDECSL